ncbi:MAG: hypothetical protein ABWY50_03750, partial [Aeromicrobium sp.]
MGQARARRAVVYCAGVAWDAVQGTDRHLARSLARDVDVLWVDPPVSAWRRASRREPRAAGRARGLIDVGDHTTRLVTIGPPFPSRAAVLPAT